MKLNEEMKLNKIYKGDAYAMLKLVDSESVDISISSPPYYKQREYTYETEIGQEQTLEYYITRLGIIYSEVLRTLTDRGSMFIVICDVKDKGSLQNVPAKLIDAIRSYHPQSIFQQMIIWEKPNPPPMNYVSKWVDNYEFVIWLSKSPNFFFQPQYEPYETDITKLARSIKFGGSKSKFVDLPRYSGKKWVPNPLGRLQRSVWKIAKSSIDTNHPAVYPEDLVTKILNAATPNLICRECARPFYYTLKMQKGKQVSIENKCEHDNFRKPIVLDPFMGSGTTAIGAINNSCDFIGFEYNPNYVNEANRRIKQIFK